MIKSWKKINKKVTSNQPKHVEAENKLTDLTAKISENRYEFLLGKIYFIDDYGYQNFLVFAPMLTLDNNKEVTNWILNGVWPE